MAYFKTGTPFTAVAANTDNTLYVANLDGSGEQALPTADIGRATPSWSPDSKWIAYSPRSIGVYTPYVLRADGSGAPIKLAQTGYTDVWSPDSSMIAVHTTDGDATSSTNLIYELATAQTRSLPAGPIHALAWSPTGESIAFVGPTPSGGGSGLLLYSLLDGRVLPISNDSITVAAPRWSPDGKHIAFLGIPGGYDYGPCL